MKSFAKTVFLVSASLSVFPAVGCNSLPWKGKEPAGQMTAEQYAAHEAENIQYDTSVDFAEDYQSAPVRSPSDSSPTRSWSAPASSGSGSCCH